MSIIHNSLIRFGRNNESNNVRYYSLYKVGQMFDGKLAWIYIKSEFLELPKRMFNQNVFAC